MLVYLSLCASVYLSVCLCLCLCLCLLSLSDGVIMGSRWWFMIVESCVSESDGGGGDGDDGDGGGGL